MKPHHYWMAYAVCLALVLAAMGWVSATVLRLESFQVAAIQKAAFEESIRLALWRMETALVPLLAQESVRPTSDYASFHPAERAYTKAFEEIQNQGVLIPSPLLSDPAPDVIVHFQVDPEGRMSSPEVPVGKGRDLSIATYGNGAAIAAASQGLADLQGSVTLARLLALLPTNRPAPSALASLPVERPLAQVENAPAANQPAPQQVLQADEQQLAQVAANLSPQQQELRNDTEYNARSQQRTKYQGKGWKSQSVEKPVVQKAPAPPAGVSPVGLPEEGVMTAAWMDSRLLLVRRIGIDGRYYVQGCWLDWPAIKADLLSEIRDLLAEADLVPVEPGSGDSAGRLLAGLPVKLVPGREPDVASGGMTPVRLSMIIAWACVLAGAGAVGLLLAGAVSLSERRGAFVSAVTHELRTPLTTFRMYTEMLADGMVSDPAKKKQYLLTLNAEANRLTHLVENVLSYARLENGRAAGHMKDVTVTDLLEQASGRLVQRAEQTGLELAIDRSWDPAMAVHADVSAVEQILFNLVDNACKYAAREGEKRLHIEVGAERDSVVIRVRDHGPGVGDDVLKRLFTPFSKSAQRAAESAPGVGLGLALSRRLARQMGGDLRLRLPRGEGACFELVLPNRREKE